MRKSSKSKEQKYRSRLGPFESRVTSQATKVDESIQFLMECWTSTLNNRAKLIKVIIHNSVVVSYTIQHVIVLDYDVLKFVHKFLNLIEMLIKLIEFVKDKREWI